MIATVVFFTEVPMFKGVLMSDVWSATMHERARQILVRARTRLEDVEFVSGERRRAQEGTEEVKRFGRIQDGCWGFWTTSWFAFIPESGFCL